jgi:hypothetical protein
MNETMAEHGAHGAETGRKLWKVEDGRAFLDLAIADDPANCSADEDVQVVPRVYVEVKVGDGRLTPAAARRMAAVLVEAADRAERGDGFAR